MLQGIYIGKPLYSMFDDDFDFPEESSNSDSNQTIRDLYDDFGIKNPEQLLGREVIGLYFSLLNVGERLIGFRKIE